MHYIQKTAFKLVSPVSASHSPSMATKLPSPLKATKRRPFKIEGVWADISLLVGVYDSDGYIKQICMSECTELSFRLYCSLLKRGRQRNLLYAWKNWST